MMLGGVIGGYCATGKFTSATAPARKITIDRTDAKIGRSMKKCENIILCHWSLVICRLPLSLFPSVPLSLAPLLLVLLVLFSSDQQFQWRLGRLWRGGHCQFDQG